MRPGALGAPDHLHDLAATEHRSEEERETGRRAARRSLRIGLGMFLAGTASLFVPARIVAVLGVLLAFLGLLVMLVAVIQGSVLRGPAGGDEAGEEE